MTCRCTICAGPNPTSLYPSLAEELLAAGWVRSVEPAEDCPHRSAAGGGEPR